MKALSQKLALLAILLGLLAGCGPVDPRMELFNADEAKLTSGSHQGGNDSLETSLYSLFRKRTNADLNPRDFNYYVSISADHKRLLVLIQMPKLKEADKNHRADVVDIVEEWQQERPALRDMKLYLGVKGKYTFMITKTPGQAVTNTLLAATSDLYDFYGPASQYAKPEPK
jgi:hypothetical protein